MQPLYEAAKDEATSRTLARQAARLAELGMHEEARANYESALLYRADPAILTQLCLHITHVKDVPAGLAYGWQALRFLPEGPMRDMTLQTMLRRSEDTPNLALQEMTRRNLVFSARMDTAIQRKAFRAWIKTLQRYPAAYPDNWSGILSGFALGAAASLKNDAGPDATMLAARMARTLERVVRRNAARLVREEQKTEPRQSIRKKLAARKKYKNDRALN